MAGQVGPPLKYHPNSEIFRFNSWPYQGKPMEKALSPDHKGPRQIPGGGTLRKR